jgi:hypothetical protein
VPPNPSAAENRLADVLPRDSRSQHRPGLHHRSGVRRPQLARLIPVPPGQPPRNGLLSGRDHMVASHATGAGVVRVGTEFRYALQQASPTLPSRTRLLRHDCV